MKKMMLMSALLAVSAVAQAKLPAPVLDAEAKAKAEVAKAKAAHGTKVEGYKLCLSMDRAAANHRKSVANAKPATATPACVDPGAFVAPVAAAAPAKP